MPGGKQIFLTDGTVGHVLSRFAVVIVKEDGINAHAAVMTMGKIFAATHATESTVGAVIRRLLSGHP